MMNKEEIISEQLGSIYHSKTASELSSFYNCMDEYAKQQAIAFANFKLPSMIIKGIDKVQKSKNNPDDNKL